MLIKLSRYNFSGSKVVFKEKQKDYDIFENESAIVFIYGYPYSIKSDKWVSSNDIYRYYLTEKLHFNIR